MNELLLWSPDLFAYTSYLMSLTGAYQLVVSPPKGKKWQPTNREVKEWLGIGNTNSNGKESVDYYAVDSLDKKVDDSDWVEKSVLGISLKNWLLDFVRDSKPDHSEFLNLTDIEKDKWGGDEHFVKTKVNGEVKAIIKELIESFKKIKLKVEDIHKFDKSKYKTVTDDDVLQVSIGQLFKYDEESNWVQFVQGIGDSWQDNLKSITNKEFYLINDAQLDKDGDPIYDKISGKFVQWDEKQWEKNKEPGIFKDYGVHPENKTREEELLAILLKLTPPLLIACWAFFYNKVNKIEEKKVAAEDSCIDELSISKLLCNRDDIQQSDECAKLWQISQSLLTMHSIADICCTNWGLKTVDKDNDKGQWFAERLLFEKGSLSTINTGRGRVMPKRHNPGVGITLRSISSNLGFHRSSVEVVWRKTVKTPLEDKIKEKGDTFSILLLPFPLDIKVKDFSIDKIAQNHVNVDTEKYGFFAYEPQVTDNSGKITGLIERANDELKEDRFVDAIIFPEDSLSTDEYHKLEDAIKKKAVEDIKFKPPSLFISGVRESRADLFNSLPQETQIKYILEEREKTDKEIKEIETDISNEKSEVTKKTLKNKLDILQTYKNILDEEPKISLEDEGVKNFLADQIVNFSRNAVYCKYFNDSDEQKSYTYKLDGGKIPKDRPPNITPKFEQYKHHRWRLDYSQIVSYGLSQILDENKIWWEAIKIPKRRVSFLNVGDKMTISHLVCEDLARQDPIADLIRHVGPSLVVTLLMDGPQLKARWSSRYASILSDDPGSSVIALTSWGMTKRHSSSFGLMSKVVALWSESDGKQREIELADGAEAVLLNLKLDEEKEKTADGRQERSPTTVLRLLDVIQIYPDK